MPIKHCMAKLLKRLKRPDEPLEPAPQINPLGKWYADAEFWHAKPFVVILNAATGLVLVLPGNAAGLRRLNERQVLPLMMNGPGARRVAVPCLDRGRVRRVVVVNYG